MKKKIRIAIFASGNGSNAENIIQHFYKHDSIEVHNILCNRKEAFVLKRAEKYNIETKIFNREDFYETHEILNYLDWYRIDFIVLAGFLWLMPQNILEEFTDKVINIHPALLPNYGGKGMYGMNVHNAVVANQEKKTGISIHLVNQHYDDGRILFQAETPVEPNDTAESIAKKIHELEMKHFPNVVEDYIHEHEK